MEYQLKRRELALVLYTSISVHNSSRRYRIYKDSSKENNTTVNAKPDTDAPYQAYHIEAETHIKFTLDNLFSI